jgi:CubicO group peptidase (beta-lactamase class C family)
MQSGSVNKSLFGKITAIARREMKKHHIPGAIIALSIGGKEYFAPLGVTSVDNPLPVDENTLFKIASISKTFLATAAVMLAERGKLGLDVPVRKYLPSFALKDKKAAHCATMRHLLTHTGGWYGDYFDDCGDGDDALDLMVRRIAKVPQIAPLGEYFSYSNTGFNIAGRVLEVRTGKTFEHVIEDMVFKPLGLNMSFYAARDILLHRYAIGHKIIKGKPVVAKPWGRARCAAPTGGILCTACDLLKYARFQMCDGCAADGKRLMSAKSMELLHTPQLPAYADRRVALSWFVHEKGGMKILTHEGGTMGNISDLSIIPEQKFASVIFTNGVDGGFLVEAVNDALLENFFGVKPQPKKPLKLQPDALHEYAGHYENPDTSVEVKIKLAAPTITITNNGGFPTPEHKVKGTPRTAPFALYARDKFYLISGPMQGFTGEFVRGKTGRVGWIRLTSLAKKTDVRSEI